MAQISRPGSLVFFEWLWGGLLYAALGLCAGLGPLAAGAWAFVFTGAALTLYFAAGLYLDPLGPGSYRKVLITQGCLLLLFSLLLFLLGERGRWLGVLLPATLGHLGGVLALRTWASLQTRHQQPRQVLVVGDGDSFHAAGGILRELQARGCRVAKALPEELLEKGSLPYRDMCLLITDSVDPGHRARLLALAQAAGVSTGFIPRFDEVQATGGKITPLGDTPVICISPLGLGPGERWAKRVFDILGAALLGTLTLPVMALVWLGIRVVSPGPAIYAQERVGQGGRLFTIYKFRTMVVDAEKRTGPVLATEADPRITPLGRILRKTRLDELPQLWNVLKGDMSLVGPRPERPVFVAEYTDRFPEYPLRHQVPPGITGLAQVMGRYRTQAKDKLRFDLLYIARWSLWLDVKLLLLTFSAVIDRDSASGVKVNVADSLSTD